MDLGGFRIILGRHIIFVYTKIRFPTIMDTSEELMNAKFDFKTIATFEQPEYHIEVDKNNITGIHLVRSWNSKNARWETTDHATLTDAMAHVCNIIVKKLSE